MFLCTKQKCHNLTVMVLIEKIKKSISALAQHKNVTSQSIDIDR